jgi:uncharacterized protein
MSAIFALAGLAENLVLAVTAAVVAGAALVLGLAAIEGSETFGSVAGWLLPIAAVVAAYYATALVVEDTFGRPVLPLFRGPADEIGQRVGSHAGDNK